MKKTLKFLLRIIILLGLFLGIGGYILIGPLAITSNVISVEVYDESIPADFSAELDRINQEYSEHGGHMYFEHVRALTSSENKIICRTLRPRGFPEKDVCASGEACTYNYNAEDKNYLLKNKCPFYIAEITPSRKLFGAYKYKKQILELGKKYGIKVGVRTYFSF